MSRRDDGPGPGDRDVNPSSVRAVRIGHGGNCSSVGSVVDTLFLGAAAGGAIFAAVCAAMKEEPIMVVGPQSPPRAAIDAEQDEP